MTDEKQDGGPCESHDVHLWPQTSRDGYAPTVHGVTEDAIGINVGGYVIVQPIRTWHAQAERIAALEAQSIAKDERIAKLPWRPIETAPKDGICLFWIRPGTVADNKGWFTDTNGNPITGSGEPRIFMGKNLSWSSLSVATHWMPLPEPP